MIIYKFCYFVSFFIFIFFLQFWNVLLEFLLKQPYTNFTKFTVLQFFIVCIKIVSYFYNFSAVMELLIFDLVTDKIS